ncbi:MAG: MFS transporter [Deltaproteobacteria bacterium]|nr:MAG: MFS transporter [Deltaproteobacteria bacterium]
MQESPSDAEPRGAVLTGGREASSGAILALLCGIVFLAVINGTMVNIALPFIGREFGVGESVYAWVVISFSLMFGIFSAVHGRLADLFGVRRLYLLGMMVLGLASLLVAFAPDIVTLIGIRFVQGAGSAAMPALGPVIVSRVIPPEHRGAALGVILGSIGVAASIGPFLGGVVVQFFGWRAVFLLTATVLLAVPVAFRVLPRRLDEVSSDERFDLSGALLLGVTAAVLMLSLTVLERFGAGWEFGAMLVFGVLAGAGFLLRIHVARSPFVPPSLFGDRRYAAMLGSGFCLNATRFGTVVLVPALLVEVHALAPIWIGVILLPGALCIALLSRRAGRLSDRMGSRRPVVVGAVGVLLGNMVTAASAGVSVVGVAVGMLLYGLGFAFMQSPLLSATSWIVPRAWAGTGTGLYMTIFFLGGAFGVSVSMTAVSLQGPVATSWLGMSWLEGGAAYSNAMLCLSLLSIVPLLSARCVPGREMVVVRGAVSSGPAAERSGLVRSEPDGSGRR